MSSVLLTGGTGFIGSHTAVELLQAGRDVVLLDDLSNSEESVADRIGEITGRRPPSSERKIRWTVLSFMITGSRCEPSSRISVRSGRHSESRSSKKVP